MLSQSAKVNVGTKPTGGLRPLLCSSYPRRLGMRAVARLVQPAVKVTVGPDQLAVGVPDGCTRAFQAITTQTRLQPNTVLLAEGSRRHTSSWSGPTPMHRCSSTCRRSSNRSVHGTVAPRPTSGLMLRVERCRYIQAGVSTKVTP